MTRERRRRQVASGDIARGAAVLAIVAGCAAFVTGLGAADRPRTFAALIASWLFFTGAASGAMAFRAIFRIIGARWTRQMASVAGAQIAFAPVALVVLVVIVIGADLESWLHAEPDSSWMSVTALAIRELAVTGALFGLGFLLRTRADRREGPSVALSVVYCLAFAIAGSIWAFDFVLGTDAVFESTLIGPYVFWAAFMAGTSSAVLLCFLRGEVARRARRDAAALILALSIFWAYLFWSQYLTIWYGNLPEEVGFALRRAEGGWGVVVLVMIGAIFALPFLALLHPAGRGSRRVVSALLAIQLAGLWLNCHLLIVPSLSPGAPALDVRDVLIALGLLGAFALSVAPGVKAALASPAQSDDEARVDALTPERSLQ